MACLPSLRHTILPSLYPAHSLPDLHAKLTGCWHGCFDIFKMKQMRTRMATSSARCKTRVTVCAFASSSSLAGRVCGILSCMRKR